MNHRAASLLAVLALAGACRDRSQTPPATDSSLAQDLAMAQRAGASGPSVFNDAPLGGTAPAGRSAGAPTPSPEPPRIRTPSPRPTPRRDSPPAPIVRAPRPAPHAPVANAPDSEPERAPASAPAAAAGVIGAGSRVGLTTNARVCTRGLLVGDKFAATVSSPTIGTNGAMIPAGSTVVLEVASIDRADPVEASHVEFRVRQIDVNGDSYPAAGDVATLASMERVQLGGGNDRQRVIGGAIAGAVLGRILGKSTKSTVIGAAAGAAVGTAAANAGQNADGCLPQGSPLRLTLSRELVVRRGAI